MWVENKPEGPTTWILTMYVDKINTIEGNNFVTVLLFNYDLFSLLHYRYESMLPYWSLFFHLHNNVIPLHKVLFNESQLLQVNACWRNTQWKLLRWSLEQFKHLKVGGKECARERERERQRLTLFVFFLLHWLNQPILKHTALKQSGTAITAEGCFTEEHRILSVMDIKSSKIITKWLSVR